MSLLLCRELRWLPITERIQYKLCLLVHKMFVGHIPDYIASLSTPASEIPSRSSLRSYSNCDLVVPRTSRKIGFLCCRTPCLESAADRLETLAFRLLHAAYTGNTVWTLECAVGLIVGAHYKSLLLLLLLGRPVLGRPFFCISPMIGWKRRLQNDLYIYIYYEIVHKVHNKEKKRQGKI